MAGGRAGCPNRPGDGWVGRVRRGSGRGPGATWVAPPWRAAKEVSSAAYRAAPLLPLEYPVGCANAFMQLVGGIHGRVRRADRVGAPCVAECRGRPSDRRGNPAVPVRAPGV